MKIREFKSELWLPQRPADIFPFFADASNLETLTPIWLNFKITTPMPIAMHEGALIEYRLRVHGVPVHWRTLISTWQPPHRFVDEQIRGPYRQWIHEHTFESRDGGTLTRDLVTYAVPFDGLIHDRLVRPDIEKIFEFRSNTLRKHFSIPH